MASSLPGLGTISYSVKQPLTSSEQTFSFSGPRVRQRLRAEPVFDRSGRTQLYNRYRLFVHAWVTGDESGLGQGSATQAMEMNRKIRSILSQKGGKLVYTGFGHDIEVNTGANTGTLDLEWGPTTKEIEVNPVGSNRTFEILWEVEFCLAEAFTQGTYTVSGVLGYFVTLNSTVEYLIDDRGLCTRTIEGMYRVVNAPDQSGRNRAHLTADDYIDRIKPEVPKGWKRSKSRRRISDDRSELTYEIVDTEQPGDNAFPVGVSDMRLRHRVSTDTAGTILHCAWSGSAAVLLGYPIGLVWDRILLILRQRIEHARNFPGNGVAVVIRSIDVDEGVIGEKSIDFSLHYLVIGVKSSQLLTASGMFQKVTSTDWAAWNKSMEKTAYAIDGLSGHRLRVENDVIVNPHQQNTATILNDRSAPKDFRDAGGTLSNKKPPKALSYLRWDNEIQVSYHNPLLLPNPMNPPGQPVKLKTQQHKVEGGYGDTGIVPSDVDVSLIPTFHNGVPVIYVRIVGRAVRYGYHSEIPRIAEDLLPQGTVKDFALLECKVSRKKVADWFGVGVYAAKWDITYRIVTGDLAAMRMVIDNLDDALKVTDEDPNGNKAASE